MKLNNILVVYGKERTDLLRDRRTIFTMLIFPLLMFPIITVGFNRLESKLREKAKQETSRIMILGVENAPELVARMRASGKFDIAPLESNYAQQINDKTLRAAVEFSPGFEESIRSGSREAPKALLYYYETEVRSEMAAKALSTIIGDYRKELVEGRLAARNIPATLFTPLSTKQENVAAPEKVAGMRIGGIIPYFIIIFCLVGALHPAMDMTAGEKERGTMETLLASAASRGELVMGKFLMVVTASLVTAVISLSSFSLTSRFAPVAKRAAEHEFTYQFHVNLQAVALVFVMVLPLAIFFAALLVAISVIAKSYKEAQSYTGPLLTVAILPAIVSILPGIELNPRLAIVPILNVSLVSKEILSGNYPWGMIGLVFLSTCFYAGIALAISVYQFQREEVLFRS